ncbi:hypothetical protein GCK72_013424 [Caenorhabditis remanei]|uniref:Uncharacterized protein n=1 Tax=Caenorhabditis remanei TaxID=31234 RepID=A0A6A5GR71_CAERE|nr:hypothetical protein GCK72_013424 [Caenorhabditis remanei]KAF1756969.1 hypothetical protein GCK72_013424 [Caenorhabditis remanei]
MRKQRKNGKGKLENGGTGQQFKKSESADHRKLMNSYTTPVEDVCAILSIFFHLNVHLRNANRIRDVHVHEVNCVMCELISQNGNTREDRKQQDCVRTSDEEFVDEWCGMLELLLCE